MIKKEQKKQDPKKKSVIMSGKRKAAIARARIKVGKGIIRINERALDAYTPEIARMRIQEPIILAGDRVNKLDIRVNVRGGGWSSQAEATRLSIGKALVAYTESEELKQKFLNYDRQLLVADTRRKESRKPGTHSRARAKRQKSYR